MSWISIDIVSSTNLIQYQRECCPTTALTLKIDPFHTAHQSCPLQPSSPLQWPPPRLPSSISPTYPKLGFILLTRAGSWNGTNLSFPRAAETPESPEH